ncbi:MAG: pyruvate kinase [Elusimicrobia bacterium RIFOXYA2_FULL_39_19]|nr:MAG: pyruvate kinase [Elusimicrobia bacterium RIFOXYA2_FULL_39_19]
MVKTKIVCTIGPASESKTVLRKMMFMGMDVARLNFSHGSQQEHKKRILTIRDLNKKYRRHIRILQDLEGFRIRVGKLKYSLDLKRKTIVYLAKNSITGKTNTLPFDYEGSLADIPVNSQIFIDDGNISLLVKGRTKNHLITEVVIPGIVKEHKGINIPGVNLKFKGLTDKDIYDLKFGIENKVDYIAQSFVRNKEDILLVKEVLADYKFNCKVIAKIENRQGIDNIDEIIKVSDGIMIARGDMGVSIPIYQIPVVQKQIIKKCNHAGKFVITATQMLESMTENKRPTRAEVTDVANAVLDGTNFVMLSAETASGKNPVETVDMMNKILKFTENS